jgi:hypothetical protein
MALVVRETILAGAAAAEAAGATDEAAGTWPKTGEERKRSAPESAKIADEVFTSTP